MEKVPHVDDFKKYSDSIVISKTHIMFYLNNDIRNNSIIFRENKYQGITSKSFKLHL